MVSHRRVGAGALLVALGACSGSTQNAPPVNGPPAEANNLPRLPAPGGDGWNRMMSDQSRLFHFMAERVEPAQAQLLGTEPFNPQTGHGFGCFNCHPHEGT